MAATATAAPRFGWSTTRWGRTNKNAPVETVPHCAGRTAAASVLHQQAAVEGVTTMDANNIERPDDQGTTPVVMDIHDISPQQLAMLGVQQIAYVKPVVVNGTTAYAIHAADGTPMAVAAQRDAAMAAIVQHEMV